MGTFPLFRAAAAVITAAAAKGCLHADFDSGGHLTGLDGLLYRHSYFSCHGIHSFAFINIAQKTPRLEYVASLHVQIFAIAFLRNRLAVVLASPPASHQRNLDKPLPQVNAAVSKPGPRRSPSIRCSSRRA